MKFLYYEQDFWSQGIKNLVHNRETKSDPDVHGFLHGEIWCSMLKAGAGYGTQNRRFSLGVLFKNIFINIQINP